MCQSQSLWIWSRNTMVQDYYRQKDLHVTINTLGSRPTKFCRYLCPIRVSLDFAPREMLTNNNATGNHSSASSNNPSLRMRSGFMPANFSCWLAFSASFSGEPVVGGVAVCNSMSRCCCAEPGRDMTLRKM